MIKWDFGDHFKKNMEDLDDIFVLKQNWHDSRFCVSVIADSFENFMTFHFSVDLASHASRLKTYEITWKDGMSVIKCFKIYFSCDFLSISFTSAISAQSSHSSSAN